MRTAVPTPRDLGVSVQEYDNILTTLKSIIADGDERKARGETMFVPGKGIVPTPRGERAALAAQFAEFASTKGVSPDLVKEWELGTPIAQTPVQYTGITPYNVEPAVLQIVPKELKLRNSTPREKGVGQGLEYRRITGVSNSGSGGVANLSPFFSSVSNTITVNGTTLNRPSNISYAGDTTFAPYVELGFSDQVSYQQAFASMGFTDARALSQLVLIWAHMLGEERAMLSARNTALSVTGASGTAADDTSTTGSGLPAGTTTAVYATFSTSYGESKAITLSGTPTTSAGDGIKITSLTGVPSGTLAINIYANYSGTYYKGTTVLTTGASPATFSTVTSLPSTSADNGSYNSLGYNGFITEFTGSASGYTQNLNAALTSIDTFQSALSQMYITNGADPDVIWTTGSIMNTLWTIIQNATSSNGYRVNLLSGDNGTVAGGAVTGVVNPSTGKVVDVSAHRYMPNGVAVIHSLQVPWPDSGVTACAKVSSVVDLNVIEWPQIGMSWDSSTYSYQTLVFEAPILSGTITNINS